MSVIHEALKRAERERAAGLIPKAAVPTPSAATPPRRRRRWVVAALGVPILLLAGVYWTRQRDGSRTAPSAPGAVTAVPSSSPQPPGQSAVLRPTKSVFSDPAQLNTRAVAAFREGRPEEARRLLEQTLRLAPAMPEAHNNFGMVLLAQGRRIEAKEEYLRALALLPGYPEALNNLGLAWSGEGNHVEAIRSFEKALTAKPGYSSAHLNLAIVYDKLGKRTDAFYHYRRFLDNAGAGEKELVRRVSDRLLR